MEVVVDPINVNQLARPPISPTFGTLVEGDLGECNAVNSGSRRMVQSVAREFAIPSSIEEATPPELSFYVEDVIDSPNGFCPPNPPIIDTDKHTKSPLGSDLFGPFLFSLALCTEQKIR